MTTVSQIADALRSLSVRSVYGDAQEVEGQTVVPVAVVAFGVGGGESSDDGGGAGGGGYALPVGVYVADSLGVRFQPNPVTLLAVAIPFVWVTGHALARVVKALKK